VWGWTGTLYSATVPTRHARTCTAAAPLRNARGGDVSVSFCAVPHHSRAVRAVCRLTAEDSPPASIPGVFAGASLRAVSTFSACILLYAPFTDTIARGARAAGHAVSPAGGQALP